MVRSQSSSEGLNQFPLSSYSGVAEDRNPSNFSFKQNFSAIQNLQRFLATNSAWQPGQKSLALFTAFSLPVNLGQHKISRGDRKLCRLRNKHNQMDTPTNSTEQTWILRGFWNSHGGYTTLIDRTCRLWRQTNLRKWTPTHRQTQYISCQAVSLHVMFLPAIVFAQDFVPCFGKKRGRGHDFVRKETIFDKLRSHEQKSRIFVWKKKNFWKKCVLQATMSVPSDKFLEHSCTSALNTGGFTLILTTYFCVCNKAASHLLRSFNICFLSLALARQYSTDVKRLFYIGVFGSRPLIPFFLDIKSRYTSTCMHKREKFDSGTSWYMLCGMVSYAAERLEKRKNIISWMAGFLATSETKLKSDGEPFSHMYEFEKSHILWEKLEEKRSKTGCPICQVVATHWKKSASDYRLSTEWLAAQIFALSFHLVAQATGKSLDPNCRRLQLLFKQINTGKLSLLSSPIEVVITCVKCSRTNFLFSDHFRSWRQVTVCMDTANNINFLSVPFFARLSFTIMDISPDKKAVFITLDQPALITCEPQEWRRAVFPRRLVGGGEGQPTSKIILFPHSKQVQTSHQQKRNTSACQIRDQLWCAHLPVNSAGISTETGELIHFGEVT